MKFYYILLSCLLGSMVGTVSAQTDYQQWETSYITPKAGHGDMFEKAVAEHIKKYHGADPYKMWVFSVTTGPNDGSYFVALGPATFTQLDSRPSSDEHNVDWQTNVMGHAESVTETIYWRADKDLTNRPTGSENFSKSRFRFTTLLPGGGDRYEELIKKVIAVQVAKKYAHTLSLYWRYGASTGPHVVTEMTFANWGYLDTLSNFSKDFDEVHGEGAYDRFLEDLDQCIDRSKTYDEMLTFEPKLSSPN